MRTRTDGSRANRGPVFRRSFRGVVLALLIGLGLTGCAGLSPPQRTVIKEREAINPYAQPMQQALVRQHFNRMKRGAGGYRMGPNDVIEIHVFGYDKMNMIARVGGDGSINFPPLGQIHTAGFSERQLETILQDQLRGRYLKDPHVTVLVKEPRASEVAIVGEVGKPGRYLLLGDKRLVDLLTEAGGTTEKSGSVAYVIRFQNREEANPGGDAPTSVPALSSGEPPTLMNNSLTERIEVDLDGLFLRGEEHLNITMMPGDLVNVPAAGSVHVTGTGIEKPGTYPLTRSSKTLLQIVDEAEGLKFEASNTIMLLRKAEADGERVIQVNYRKIALDSRNDVVLRAGDTLITKRTPIKTGLAAIGKALTSFIRFGLYGTWSVPIG